MIKSQEKQDTLLHERWFWVAVVLVAYQIGISLFHSLQMLRDGYMYMTLPQIIPFAGFVLVSLALYAYTFSRKKISEKQRCIWASYIAIGGTVLEALSLGYNGIQSLIMSYIGIPISYGILFGFNEPLGVALAGITAALWIFLVVGAPKLSMKILHPLCVVLLISMLISITGCSVLSQIHD